MLAGLPGKLTISVRPRIPATPLESIQWRVCSREPARSASAIPGASRSITARLASGVRSLGAKPVPPVVRIRSQRSESAQWQRRASITSRVSGSSSTPATSAPIASANSASFGPLSSVLSPRALDVEMLRTAARTSPLGDEAVLAPPAAAATAYLLEQLDALDQHPALETLDHVVHRQSGNGGRGHGLHLDPGAAHDAGLGKNPNRARRGVDGDAHVGERARERVREGDQLARALGGLDPGEAGGAHDISLGRVSTLHGRGGLRRHAHERLRPREALALGLGADVHHAGGAGVVEVREPLAHGKTPSTQRASPSRGSRFQIGASRLIRSIASRAPAKAASRCAADAATITLV